MTHRIFLSDIHMSTSLGHDESPKSHAWAWFTKNDRERFIWFLDNVCLAPTEPPIDEVVFLGDVFDNWVFPHDVKPPVFSHILNDEFNLEVVQRLNALAARTSVLFVPGNHDMSLSQTVLESVLPRVAFAADGALSPMYVSGHLLGEHGNANALFCAPDPMRPDGLPLGYFISRMAATAVRDIGHDSPSPAEIVDQVLNVITNKEELAEAVFKAICDTAKVSDTAKICMPDDLWGGQEVTVGLVREKYANLFNEFAKRHSLLDAGVAIAAEMGDLKPTAEELHRQDNAKLVLMGHTHQALIQVLTVFQQLGAMYVNSGCWCNNASSGNWIDVVTVDDYYTVSLLACSQVGGGGPKVTTVQSFTTH